MKKKKKQTNLFIRGRRFNFRSNDFRQMQHPKGHGISSAAAHIPTIQNAQERGVMELPLFRGLALRPRFGTQDESVTRADGWVDSFRHWSRKFQLINRK